MGTTAKWALRYPELTGATGAPPDVPARMHELADDIDSKLTPIGVGMLSARPAAGKVGQRWYATDNGNEYLDIGPSWVLLTPAPSGGGEPFELQPDSVNQNILAPLAVGTPELIDRAVSIAKIADALKPSTGAGSAAEALRALGTAAGQALPGNTAIALLADLVAHAALTGTAHPMALVTSLPGSPVPGQEILLDAGSPGVIWHLKFNGGTGKWDVVGGSSLFQYTDTNSSTTTVTTYIDGASGGVPVITIPVAGDYLVSFGGRIGQNQANATTHLSPRTGAGGGSTDTDAASWNAAADAAGSDVSVARTVKKTYTAGIVVRLQFRSTSAVNSSGNAYNRFMSIMPARCG